ncbi:MAG: hypothetical protein WAL45_19335, partial [Terracidiphilus sp.]
MTTGKTVRELVNLVRRQITIQRAFWSGIEFKGALQTISAHEGRIGMGPRATAGSLAAAASCFRKWNIVSIRADKDDCRIPSWAAAAPRAFFSKNGWAGFREAEASRALQKAGIRDQRSKCKGNRGSFG